MESRRHISHLLYLFIGLIISFGFFVSLRYNPLYQFYASVAGVIYYVLWGFLHHYMEDRLNFEILAEYVLIGGIVILLFALVLGI